MTNEPKPSPLEEAIRNSVGNIYQCEDCGHTCKSDLFTKGFLDSIHCPECESMEVINQTQVAINACEEIHREKLKTIFTQISNKLTEEMRRERNHAKAFVLMDFKAYVLKIAKDNNIEL